MLGDFVQVLVANIFGATSLCLFEINAPKIRSIVLENVICCSVLTYLGNVYASQYN